MAPICDQCGQPVTFGPTEHGYRGFIHEATGTTVCPTKLPPSCAICGRPILDTLEVRACRCSAGPAGPIDEQHAEPHLSGPFGRTITSTGPG